MPQLGVEWNLGSLPARGAWIEITRALTLSFMLFWSLPARGAWIEIPRLAVRSLTLCVAPREGSVD